jgi:hypothetical protein
VRKTTSAAAVLILNAAMPSMRVSTTSSLGLGSPGEDDIGSLALSFGSLKPQSKLPDGATFGSGIAVGASAPLPGHPDKRLTR